MKFNHYGNTSDFSNQTIKNICTRIILQSEKHTVINIALKIIYYKPKLSKGQKGFFSVQNSKTLRPLEILWSSNIFGDSVEGLKLILVLLPVK